jgi:hypothetical protein
MRRFGPNVECRKHDEVQMSKRGRPPAGVKSSVFFFVIRAFVIRVSSVIGYFVIGYFVIGYWVIRHASFTAYVAKARSVI